MSDEESKLKAEGQQPSDDLLALTADDHLRGLYIEAGDESTCKSIARNIKDALFPPKLPPLQVTSKPVPVKDIWDLYGYKKSSGLYSLFIHVAVVTLLFSLAANKTVQQAVTKTVSLVTPLDIAPYTAQRSKSTGGGGWRRPFSSPRQQGSAAEDRSPAVHTPHGSG